MVCSPSKQYAKLPITGFSPSPCQHRAFSTDFLLSLATSGTPLALSRSLPSVAHWTLWGVGNADSTRQWWRPISCITCSVLAVFGVLTHGSHRTCWSVDLPLGPLGATQPARFISLAAQRLYPGSKSGLWGAIIPADGAKTSRVHALPREKRALVPRCQEPPIPS